MGSVEALVEKDLIVIEVDNGMVSTNERIKIIAQAEVWLDIFPYLK